MGKYDTKTDADVSTTVVEEVETEKKETVSKRTSKKVESKKKFEPSSEIDCRSIVQGQLFMDGVKTGRDYRWEDYGDTTGVEYRDLVSLVHSKSGYIFNPFFIIDNEDFIKEFPQLEKFYKENYSVRELSDILALPNNEMVSTIQILPKSAVDTLKKIAVNQVTSGQIDSVRKIRALDEVFGTDLNLIAEVFNQ